MEGTHNKGFTLIEVIVSALLLAIAIVGVFGAIPAGIKTQNKMKEHTQGIGIGETRLERYKADQYTVTEQKITNCTMPILYYGWEGGDGVWELKPSQTGCDGTSATVTEQQSARFQLEVTIAYTTNLYNPFNNLSSNPANSGEPLVIRIEVYGSLDGTQQSPAITTLRALMNP